MAALNEEVTFAVRNLANAKTFLVGHTGANSSWGLIHDGKKEIV
jgi:hypothetical protein